uniref:NADPH oxidase 1 isoform X2 n=1 Tax=Phascolarctos cinereus TaxID=38626 RepID=A0A6P5IK71_PHACI|nr:NADPH oxidase 1 isoform X2 [Phascolarctos cinereus]
MGNWVVNHGFSAVALVVWLGLNVFLFVYAFLTFEKSDKYYYTREIIGSSLAWARASARCLNFNSLLILLPVCRNLLSFLRGSCLCCRRTLRKQLDHNLTFHKLVAYMICLHTVIHIGAHLFNFERYSRSCKADNKSLAFTLSTLYPHEKGSPWLNPFPSPNMTAERLTFTSIAGLTGVIITLALILMVTSATELVRRCYFEVFWYTHHLFVFYFIGLVIHGIGGIVRGQTEDSMKEHPHSKCAEEYDKWGEPLHCKRPQFEGLPAEAILHPSKVLELQMNKCGFRMEVGQYIFVNCPSVSPLEWHPFTLTSAPEEPFFSIHIRAAGDWTESLIKACEQQNSPLPRLEVDGPFGTASEDVFQYEVAMLVGAGIGVTPFASILKSIWYKFRHADHTLKTKTIYFYWICRETGAFAWFNDLLASLEREMEECGKVGFLNYRLFLTGWDSNIVGHAALHFDKSTDVVTGLKQKTSFGRPQWDNEFSAVAAVHPRSVVGVFLCGPQSLAKSLRKCCNHYSSLDPRKVRFYFNKENF